jgi:hypothetical protein
MDVVRLIIPAAALLALAGAFFGVVVARVVWADDATQAAKLKASYQEIQRSYNKIHEMDQNTIATMRQTIDLLQHNPR